MSDLYERLGELLNRNEESRPGVKDFAMAVHSSFLREVMEALAYAREVCFDNGHVRSGVGNMNRCSRCGELVDDAMMEAQRRRQMETLHRAIRRR